MELILQRRHSPKCPDRSKGPNFLKCRGHCKLRAMGYDDDDRRIRKSLNTRDLATASRILARAGDAHGLQPPRKSIAHAISAFIQQKADKAPETRRKYVRVMSVLRSYCERRGLRFLPELTLEALDAYVIDRRKLTATWIKEIEILRHFFKFCNNRKWTDENPAAEIETPRLPERDEIVPYTPQEVARIIAACDRIGRTKYERLRARAMVLLMRFAGLRISDVVTLSRDHVQATYIVKRAIKNGRKLKSNCRQSYSKLSSRSHIPRRRRRIRECILRAIRRACAALVKGAERVLAAVFKRVSEDGCNHLDAIIRRHYWKWNPEFQSRKDGLRAESMAQI